MINVTNMDVIATMSDEDIHNTIQRLEEYKKNLKNTKEAEVEIAYHQRELGFRQHNRKQKNG
jgi:hypothetical protein